MKFKPAVMPTKKQSLRSGIRKASASGNNAKAARLSKKFEKAGGNAEKANARITKGLAARDTRKQLRSAIKTGDKKAVRGATKAVRATNTSEKRKGVAMKIKQKTGYKTPAKGAKPRRAVARKTNAKNITGAPSPTPYTGKAPKGKSGGFLSGASAAASVAAAGLKK